MQQPTFQPPGGTPAGSPPPAAGGGSPSSRRWERLRHATRRGASFLSRHPAAVRGTLLAATFFACFGAGAAYGSWALACRGGACPSASTLESYTPRQTSKLFAADGRFVAEIGNERRTLITIKDIPPMVRDAFLVVEDKRFYSHSGIDWLRVPGATLRNVRARSWREGFSTITMQLARNIFTDDLSREKTLVRKVREGKVAREIEAQYPKDRILELYLNQIYLGAGAHGVETAAQRYFGKSVRDVNLAEAALLAALPKGPERYNPRRFPERAIQRRNTVIELLRRAGRVSDVEASEAKAYPLQLASRTESGDVAPYFVEWVRQQLEVKFGRQVYEEGLKVYTTLDVDMQSAAERALVRQLDRIEAGRYGPFPHRSYEAYITRETDEAGTASSTSPYLQGLFIALDPRTGAVRALVGGRDFADSKFNRATQALRQPGSTFKPIVYSAAVQAGRPPSYIYDDSPVNMPNGDGTDWSPQNYDGKFMGPMPMRRGLYMSRNIVAIRAGMELGPQAIADQARRFGITSNVPPYPSIFLGSADVIPMELVAGYSVFATLGSRSVPYAIARVENQRGDILWEPEEVRVPVLSQEEAYLMVSMMKDVNVRGTAAGAVGGAGFDVPSGGKTGTTNDGTDVWYVGYTPDLVAGVWMGFDKPQKIKSNAQGGELAAPAWTAFMTEVYRRKPNPPDWPQPMGIVSREIVAGTNILYSPECYGVPVATDLFIAGTEPVETCVPGNFAGIPGYDSLGVRTDSAGAPIPGTTVPGAPGAYPPGTYPPGTTPPGASPYPTTPRPTVPVDTTADTTGTGATPPLTPRRPRPVPLPMPGSRPTIDTAGRPRPDTARRVPDTLRRTPPDTLRRTPPDTIRTPRP